MKRLMLLVSIFMAGFAIQANAQHFLSSEEEMIANAVSDFIAFEDYESALPFAKQLDSLRPSTPLYVYQLGRCIYHAGDKPQSLLHFLKAYNLQHNDPLLLLYIAKAYHQNFDLDNAIYYLEKLIATDELPAETLTEAEQFKAQIISSREILERKLSVDIQNLGIVNSEHADYVPISLFNDSTLIFTSRRTTSTGGKLAHDGYHYEDIYVSKRRKDGEWDTAVPFPKFNSNTHDANVAINKSGTELYIFKAKHNGDIYKTSREANGDWDKPRRVKGINSRHWEGSICLSPTEDTLYFSSDRPGGFGGSDLYYAVRVDDKWTNITNLGNTINTSYDEDSPYLHKDGKTFFFSSRGHNSIGGYDVFSAKLSNGTWSGIKNLGFPINSISDDIYFQLNAIGSIGYFTSYRFSNFKERSLGEKDLFEIKRPFSSPVFFVFKGRIFNEKSQEPVPAIVTITNLEDTLQAVQRLVVDINSGKFRTDLKFENRYKINVEVNGKVYFSKELYYPYQPDLFETFLDIPLRDIPVFKMRLNDIVLDEQDTSENLVLDDRKHETILLVRKVAFDDPELKELLLSNRIPVGFRKRLMDQLKNSSFIDQPEEGSVAGDLIEEMKRTIQVEDDEMPVFLARLDDSPSTTSKVSSGQDLFNKPEINDALVEKKYEQLSEEEKNVVEHTIVNILEEQQEDLAFDDVYLLNLKDEEITEIESIIALRAKEKIETDSTLNDQQKEEKYNSLYTFIDKFRQRLSVASQPLQTFDKDAWGILYTIESSRFQYRDAETIFFNGHVVFRANDSPADSLPLILTDDRGVIYSRVATDEKGNISFGNLKPGRRYHVLVNDYAIALLGQSRYEMRLSSMQSGEDDFNEFYNNLTPEEKRSVDRVVAAQTHALQEANDAGKKWQMKADLEKLSESERKLIQRVKQYLSASTISEEDFFIDKKTAFEYEQTSLTLREQINFAVAEQLAPTTKDTLFYNMLTPTEKGYVERIRQSREARKTILEDVLLSEKDSDYWYILDEIKLDSISFKNASISARIVKRESNSPQQYQVALLDDDQQIHYATISDSSGLFFMPGVTTGKKYKVLMSIGTNIGDLSDYHLTDLRIEGEDSQFLESLTAAEKKMIDRIIAVRMAEDEYQRNQHLRGNDQQRYSTLSLEEKEFIDRIRKHLFPDSLNAGSVHLDRADNHAYYFQLSQDERAFINRVVVKTHYDNHLKTEKIALTGRDKKYYQQLPDAGKKTLVGLQRKRYAERDIIAENPALIADKAWVMLDSITVNNTSKAEITGTVLHSKDSTEAQNLTLMITNVQHDIVRMVSTDSSGHFSVSNVKEEGKYHILAQIPRSVLKKQSHYFVKDLMVTNHYDTGIDTVYISIFFAFDSDKISVHEQEKLLRFLQKNISTTILREVSIAAHTDRTGPNAYNYQLSERRAKSVISWLKSNNIHYKTILQKSYGESQPRYSGTKEHLNRRVDMIWIFSNN